MTGYCSDCGGQICHCDLLSKTLERDFARQQLLESAKTERYIEQQLAAALARERALQREICQTLESINAIDESRQIIIKAHDAARERGWNDLYEESGE